MEDSKIILLSTYKIFVFLHGKQDNRMTEKNR